MQKSYRLPGELVERRNKVITVDELISNWGYNRTKSLPIIANILNSIEEIKVVDNILIISEKDK
jgi:hypothetical protein